jgi:hypothetical protein
MSAIITDPFKKQFMQKILDEVTDLTARYYVGIGKNDEWNSTETVPTPTDAPKTIREAQNALQSVKAVASTSFVIPRYNWTSGSIYNAYDDKYATIPSNTYYVLTDDNHVYICLQQSKNDTGVSNVSTIKPTGTSPKPFKTSDGYTWRFLYSLSASITSSFLSANFIPIKFVDSADGAFETQQKTAQDSADAGRILNIVVETKGSGYTSTPTVTITGNSGAIGDSAQATATVLNEQIVKIDMLNESAGSGKNFVNATVTISGGGGSGCIARAVLGPLNGIGADPRDDLKATSLMFNSKPDGTENGDFLAGNDQDFRQVLLIRNPKTDSANGNPFEGTTAKALRYLQVDSAFGSQLQIDELITNNSTPPANAYVNEAINFDASSMKVYYHQTDSTGYTPFSVGDTLADEGGDEGDIVVVADSNEQYINTSGEVLYIENRAPVERSTSQTEDIKVVVTL